MKKFPMTYSTQEMDRITQRINERFEVETKSIVHEMESDFIHTDVLCAEGAQGALYATMGMGARPTDAPLPQFCRTELILISDQPCVDITLPHELVGLSKVPFENETWFGPGHTIAASKKVREQYGYDAYIFMDLNLTCPLDNGEEVRFLGILPIYAEEREWIMENDSFLFLDHFDGMEAIDRSRELYIPEGDIEGMKIMHALGIDEQGLEALGNFIDQLHQEGKELDPDTLDQWLEDYKKR